MKFAKTKLLLCLFYNEQINQKISFSTCYHSLVTVSSVPPIFRSFPSPLISLHPLVLLARSLKTTISRHHGPSHLLSLRLLQISEFALLLFFFLIPLCSIQCKAITVILKNIYQTISLCSVCSSGTLYVPKEKPIIFLGYMHRHSPVSYL